MFDNFRPSMSENNPFECYEFTDAVIPLDVPAARATPPPVAVATRETYPRVVGNLLIDYVFVPPPAPPPSPITGAQ